jgi:hypothetical protein
MNVWSKGLGRKTIDLRLSAGEALNGGDQLYVKGQMEAPVSWEYVMSLRADDLAEFFELLRDPALIDFVYGSPECWRLIRGMVIGGLQLAGLVLAAGLQQLFTRNPAKPAVELELPPPRVRERKRVSGRRLGSRRRLPESVAS